MTDNSGKRTSSRLYNCALQPLLATSCNVHALNNYSSMYQEVWTDRYYQPYGPPQRLRGVHKVAVG